MEEAQADACCHDQQSPEASVIARNERERLLAAIQALPSPYRAVLILRDIEGLSYRELAGVLDVPLGTVMSRLARARARLIAEIGEPSA